MDTVCTASYSVLRNGEPRGFITLSRGMKQGDPLSPYLFLLCAEGLSALIRRVEETQSIHGILSSAQGVRNSRLLFADDSLLFCHATVGECQNLMYILQEYEEASSQANNRQKTSLFFNRNKGSQVKVIIQHMLGPKIMMDCERYLGLPMVGGKSKINTF